MTRCCGRRCSLRTRRSTRTRRSLRTRCRSMAPRVQAGGYVAERGGHFLLADNAGIGEWRVICLPLPLSACCRDCAATGDVAKSSAVINAELHVRPRFGAYHRPTIAYPGRYRTRGMFHYDAAYEAACIPSTGCPYAPCLYSN